MVRSRVSKSLPGATIVTATALALAIAAGLSPAPSDARVGQAESAGSIERRDLAVSSLAQNPVARDVEAAFAAKFGREMSAQERQGFYTGLQAAIQSSQLAQAESTSTSRRLIDAEDPNEVTVWLWCFGANVGVVASGGARLCYSANTEQKWHTVVSTNVGHVQASLEATWISLTIPALARASVRGSYRYTGASFAVLGGLAYYSFNEEGRSRMGTTFNTTAQARRGRVFAIQVGGGAGVAGVSSNDTLIID